MEKINLDKTWKYCIDMWIWIVERKRNGSRLSVTSLKRQWCRENGFYDFSIKGSCFFCHYASQNPVKLNELNDICSCYACPGTLIDKDFYCSKDRYSYEKKPFEFLQEMLRLNKIRLERKKEKI